MHGSREAGSQRRADSREAIGYLVMPPASLTILGHRVTPQPKRDPLGGLPMVRALRSFVQHYVFAVLATCAWMTGACFSSTMSWRPLDSATPVNPQDIVWIWSGAEINKWDAVVITSDSVSGIPYEVPLPCDNCRRSLPRSQIDSMHVPHFTRHFDSKPVLEGAGAIAAALLLELALCSRGC